MYDGFIKYWNVIGQVFGLSNLYLKTGAQKKFEVNLKDKFDLVYTPSAFL